MPKKKALQLANQAAMSLSEEHIKSIEQTERTGTAMMETGQELLLAVEEVLQREFHFDEEQLRHLEGKVQHMLVSLAELERKGLSILSMHDMRSVGEIAEIREQRLREKQTGVLLPKNVKD